MHTIALRPIGRVESPLTDPAQAPRQADEGAPEAWLTLDADFVARGPDGERTIAAGDFFTGPFETALGPQELLTEIRVPKVEGGRYLKHVRRQQDWATVAVAAARLNGDVHVGLAGMGPTPLRARAVGLGLTGGIGVEFDESSGFHGGIVGPGRMNKARLAALFR